ncbi:40249_t:CDS:2, partial [Gigaspora margarita]
EYEFVKHKLRMKEKKFPAFENNRLEDTDVAGKDQNRMQYKPQLKNKREIVGSIIPRVGYWAPSINLVNWAKGDKNVNCASGSNESLASNSESSSSSNKGYSESFELLGDS